VDTAPAPFERDAPLWLAEDRASRAYLATCAGVVGDPVDPRYLDGVFASALVADGMAAYDAGRHRDALDLFGSALRAPGGEQLRAYNGLYLANWALGRRAEAEEAFGRGAEFGLGTSASR
jgi:tetratricopeptide (TPR) repeat protein